MGGYGMRNCLALLFVLVLTIMVVIPAWSQVPPGGEEEEEEEQSDEKKIDNDDYIMFAVGGILGAGTQALYFRDKAVVESKAPPIIMGYFIWNAIVVLKELHDDPPEDRLYWGDILVANAGFTLGVVLWHYTVGKNIKTKPKRRAKTHYGYLTIDGQPTQIKLY
jgi:hypothetical protein